MIEEKPKSDFPFKGVVLGLWIGTAGGAAFTGEAISYWLMLIAAYSVYAINK